MVAMVIAVVGLIFGILSFVKTQKISDLEEKNDLLTKNVQELAANLDAGVTSTFLYKSQDSDKLVFSPVWDFDHAYGDDLARFIVQRVGHDPRP